MKKLLCAFLVLLLAVQPVCAFAYTLSPGDEMLVRGAGCVPLYASYIRSDPTVITYVSSGETVLYIAAVDRGCCVAYGSFVGYMDENYLEKAGYYSPGFTLPDGSQYKAISGGAATPYPTYPPNDSYYSDAARFTYAPLTIYPNRSISTRTGPGTGYTEPGTFPSSYDYVAYYQTEGSSVYWGYVEFTERNLKYRAYTGVKRFSVCGNLPVSMEDYVYKTVSVSCDTYYGPGYNYAVTPFECPYAGMRVKAFFTENGWTMIEYELSNGYLHRGWVPGYCLY